MPSYALSQRAYVTLLLHALKHPASPVSGVVLGPAPRAADAGGSPPGSPRAAPPRQLTLTVPLFHTQPALAPMLEVALAQVDAYAAANGLAIVAYYAANERPEDEELTPAARRIADKIAAACPGACALLVDAGKLAALGSTSPEIALKLLTRDAPSGAWRAAAPGSGGDSLSLLDAGALAVAADYAAEGRARRLVDFDDHLDDISRDWLNPTLFS